MTVNTRNRALTGLLLAAAAVVLPVTPAAAAPAAVNCWYEQDIYKSGNAIVAYAYKDCVDLPVATPLSVSIEQQICDGSTHCEWIKIKTGLGSVTLQCKPDYVQYLRHSRVHSDREWCNYG